MNPARLDRRRPFPVLLRAALAAGIAVFGVVGAPVTGPAAAGGLPVSGAPTQGGGTTVGPGGLPTARAALGVVTVRKRQSLGWIAADGAVVTSDAAVAEVGVTATFRADGTTIDTPCYVGHHETRLRMSVLRCSGLAGPALGIATQFPAPGATAIVPFLASSGRQNLPATFDVQQGTLLDNNVRFMGSTRLRFSFSVQRVDGPGTLNQETLRGAPVLDDQNRVISVLFAAPEAGGQPLGTTAKEVQDAVDATVSLPDSFTSAAVLAIGRRAVIPVIVGAVIGLIWGVLSRNGTTLYKTVGLGLAGVIGAVLYSAFTVMVIGPQTLVG